MTEHGKLLGQPFEPLHAQYICFLKTIGRSTAIIDGCECRVACITTAWRIAHGTPAGKVAAVLGEAERGHQSAGSAKWRHKFAVQ